MSNLAIGRAAWFCTAVVLLSTNVVRAQSVSLVDVQAAAKKQGVVVDLPHYERTPEAIAAAADAAIKQAEERLQQLARQDIAAVTFDSTIAALDHILFDVRTVANRVGLLKDTLPDKAAREAASSAAVKLSSWTISLDYREDIYRVVRAFADTQPKLTGEDLLLLEETLRDYRRAGLALPEAERKQVEELRKQLTTLCTEFSNNVISATAELPLSAEDAQGIPESFLNSPGVKQTDGSYRALMNVTWHWEAVIEHAKNPLVRKRAHELRYSLAKEPNVALLAKIVALRTEIAQRLGYPTWADFQIEPRMAKTAARARSFLEDLSTGLQPKYEAETEELRQLKAKETNDAGAKLDHWDFAYYTEKLKRERYSVDAEQLRVYFPYKAVVAGMFRIYEKIFGLEFTEVEPPEKWTDDLQLFAVKDRATGAPIGMFYFDMFPREGKYNHFACFPIHEGIRRRDGTQVVPVAALVCNFPPAAPDRPSLLKHDEVEILYHEFGHIMHHVLGRSKHPRHFAFNVEQDFVEAPSQMLENWVWEKTVLDTFAADYRDSTKKVPAEIIDAMKRARVATSAMFYRRQLSFGILDLVLHTQTEPNPHLDVAALTNRELARIHVAPAPGTAFVAYFNHLAGGYDAGYYGYMWSLAIAQDMASVFAAAHGGFLDEAVGRRLRDEIYAAAASRPATESVQRFLGRPQSIEPFLKFVGAKSEGSKE